MGKRGKAKRFGQRNNGGGGGPRAGGGGKFNQRIDYNAIPRENEKLQSYYNGILGLDEAEQTELWEAFRRDLPNSFRFCGSKGNALAVQKHLVRHYIPEIAKMDAFDGVSFEPPQSISWYPDNLAWSMNAPKSVIRRYPPFAAFQKFLVSETSVGHISRQEMVSMIPPLLMDVKRGMTILDMCAAPGSKTCQLVELMHRGEEAMTRKFLRLIAKEKGGSVSPDGMEKAELEEEQEAASGHNDWSDDGRCTGLLIANDSEYKRSYLLIHQTKRLHSPNLIVTNHDASIFPSIRLPSTSANGQKNSSTYLKFDRILADVPCSGDGTLRKNAMIWKDWTPGNALGLHSIQTRILIRALQLLKVGGRAVYSTCSLNPIENEAVVAASIDRCGGPSKVRLVDCGNSLPGLKRRPGLKSWKVIGRSGRVWNSWQEVEEAREKEGEEAVKRIFQTNFPPVETSDIPLENCMRVYPHLQDTGGFFICVLEKLSEIKARPQATATEGKIEAKAKVEEAAPIVAAVNELESKADKADGSIAHLNSLDGILPQLPISAPSTSATARQNREPSPDRGLKRDLEDLDDGPDPKRSRTSLSPPAGLFTKSNGHTSSVEVEQKVASPAPPVDLLDLDTQPQEGQSIQDGIPKAPSNDLEDTPGLNGPEQEVRPPRVRRGGGGGGSEEPFIYLAPEHPELEHIYGFYKLSSRFPRNRFMVRNNAGTPAKGIYYTSELCRDILTANEGSGIKFVHCGVKIFVKQDIQRQNTCPWRIQNEGLPLVEAWVGEERVVRLWSKDTLYTLLTQMFPKVADNGWKDLGEIGEWARDAETGCYVLRIEISDKEDGLSERMVIPLWRSLHSLNLMLPKEDRRAMLLRLYNEDRPHIENHTVKRQKIIDDRKVEEDDGSEVGAVIEGDEDETIKSEVES